MPHDDNELEKDISKSMSGIGMKGSPATKKKPTFEVHSMPSKFHLSKTSGISGAGSFEQPVKKDKGNFGKIVLFVVIGVVVIGLGVIGYLVLQKRGATNTANANQNSNQNANANTIPTLNFNTNKSNVNGTNSNTNTSNTNTNANANQNSNSNSNSNTNTNQAKKDFGDMAQSQDLDKDELTDVEETLYSTSKTTEDTDGDSFKDGIELRFGYSPIDKGKLAASSVVKSYTNNTYGFKFLYPASWTVQPRGSDEKGVFLLSEDAQQYIDISVQDNIGRLEPLEWYQDQNPTASAADIEAIKSWDEKAEGVISVDGYSTHFGSGNYMYTFFYSIGTSTELDYKATYEMITKSITFFTPAPVVTNTNTNSNSNLNGNTNETISIPLNSNTNTNSNSNANTNTNTNSNSNSNTNS